MHNLASPLQGVPHLAAFEDTFKAWLENVDLSMILVNIYDTAPEEILDLLAGQLDMLGYNGWILADTVAKKRDLLKRAISIKKKLGTPYAIRQIAEALGIVGDIFIEEGVAFLYDGTVLYDGSNTYGSGQWAVFQVRFSEALNPTVDADTLDKFEKMINQIKPARSRLKGVYLY